MLRISRSSSFLTRVGLMASLAACSADVTTAPGARGLAASLDQSVAATCPELTVPAGNRVLAQYRAVGTQGYYWSGSAWALMGTTATLYGTTQSQGEAATQSFMGFTSRSGSSVVGQVDAQCTGNTGALPWLLLRAISHQGSGIFDGVTFIQRVNTSGGAAPATPGSFFGEQTGVPFTADYVFYRAK